MAVPVSAAHVKLLTEARWLSVLRLSPWCLAELTKAHVVTAVRSRPGLLLGVPGHQTRLGQMSHYWG